MTDRALGLVPEKIKGILSTRVAQTAAERIIFESRLAAGFGFRSVESHRGIASRHRTTSNGRKPLCTEPSVPNR